MENIETTCAFTGHRPDKLGIDEKQAKTLLCRGIEYAIEQGYTTFITGMATGVDLWAGELVLKYRKVYPHIRIICALPYPTFSMQTSLAKEIVSTADGIYSVMDNYTIYSYQKRNEWMVDRSSLVIALFNGERGGTYNTIKYAEKKGINVLNVLDDSPLQLSLIKR